MPTDCGGATIGRPSDGQICILLPYSFRLSTLGTALSLVPQGQSVIPQSSNKKEVQRGIARQTSVMDPMPLQWPALIKLALSSTNSNLYTLQTLDSLRYSSECRHVYHIPLEPALSADLCASSADSAWSACDSASRQGDSTFPPPRSAQ